MIEAWQWPQKPPRGATLDQTHPLARGLVGFWPFVEGSGLPADVASKAPTTSNTLAWSAAPGRIGPHLKGDGTNKSVKVSTPQHTPLDVAGPISFGGWAYPTVSNVYQCILSRAVTNDTNRQYSVFLDTTGTGHLFVAINGAVPGTIAVSPGWTVNAWNHIIITYDGTASNNTRAYINGVLAATATIGSGPVSQANSFIYMGAEGASYQINGYLDGVGVWARALAPGEISQLYANPWRIFRAPDAWLWSAWQRAPSTTGAMALTLGADVFAGAGSFLTPGAMGITLEPDTLAGAGSFATSATMAVLLGVDTFSAVASQAGTLAFRATLVAKLESIPALTAIVGDAIYPGAIPETHQLARDGPALTYAVISYPRGHVLSGSDGTATPRVRLDAWSHSEAEADAVTLAIWNALDGPPVNPWASGGVAIVSVSHGDENDLSEPPKDGNDRWVYRITSQYRIRHRVTLPTLS